MVIENIPEKVLEESGALEYVFELMKALTRIPVELKGTTTVPHWCNPQIPFWEKLAFEAITEVNSNEAEQLIELLFCEKTEKDIPTEGI